MLIGMAEAGKRLGVATSSALRALSNAGVKIVQLSEKAYAVEESDLNDFIAARQANGYKGRGRPRKTPISQTP